MRFKIIEFILFVLRSIDFQISFLIFFFFCFTCSSGLSLSFMRNSNRYFLLNFFSSIMTVLCFKITKQWKRNARCFLKHIELIPILSNVKSLVKWFCVQARWNHWYVSLVVYIWIFFLARINCKIFSNIQMTIGCRQK